MTSITDANHAVIEQVLNQIQPIYSEIDRLSRYNTKRVLDIFRRHKVSEHHFHGSSGYGYDDNGRDKLDLIWAEIFGAEKALVRTQFASGTHALSTVLFGILRPGDELISVTGTPYDTMQTVLGVKSKTPGSLTDIGINYNEVPMGAEGVDYSQLSKTVTASTKMVLIQRSRGYSLRPPLSVDDISRICAIVKNINPNCICFVDNCYGEFVEECEPTAVGADILAGSLIKNPGGGIAPTGGYVAGRADLVDLASYRLTAPGIGSEVGSSVAGYRLLYQGIFLAPHVVAQALKSAVFAAAYFAEFGYNTVPHYNARRSDIIQAIELGTPEKMIAFCQGLQLHSPVDSHVRPEASGMPGYSDAVVMAGGTFVQGSSIELSADGPIRPPFVVYLQGGLSFEHSIIAIQGAKHALDKY
ncbi:MAG: Aluminum resistance family protein [Firmicutes bacterium]|nr:Aluminum resistance family protein [Bacillota bacterium]